MKKKISIRVKFTLIFAFILGLAIFLSVLCSNLFLEKYYVVNRSQTMVTAYDNIRQKLSLALQGEDKDESEENEEKQKEEEWVVFPGGDEGGLLIRKNQGGRDHGRENRREKDALSEYLDELMISSNISSIVITGDTRYIPTGMDVDSFMTMYTMLMLGKEYIEKTASDYELISSNSSYQIFKIYDSFMDTNYLVCYGTYDDGTRVILRTALMSLAESAQISNRFYIYVGVIVLLVGTIVVYIVMRLITKPITNLTEISKKMSDLDFDAKYTGRSRDEIGELGTHMNEMSEKLESTIAQLKSANNELQQDINAKEDLARERSEFVANVSHELKTPIALIQGYAEGLKDGVADDPESMAYYCDVISDEADKMNRMVKRLLSLNQLEFGAEKLEMSRFDMTQLIEAIAGSSAILAKQKEAVIVFNRKEPLYVWADEYRMEEVISNFISNAIHYVSGRNIIEIRLEEKDGSCIVEVYNSGSHIPEEDLDRIWEKFYKVDKARTREYGGNGIGLSIVKAVVALHGGTVCARNTDDGVVFIMTIPTQSG